MKLLATHAFNCIVLMIKFGLTSCEDIPPALFMVSITVEMSKCITSKIKSQKILFKEKFDNPYAS